jgi:dihydroflavonol-4-reductase
MRVFVTGGNGFIGSCVVRELFARGHSVVCLLRPTSKTDRIDDLPFERAGGDVRDVASLRAGMNGCDATVHLAAPSDWHVAEGPYLDDVIVNGARRVLEAASGLSAHRVVLISSSAAINASEQPIVFDERAEFGVRDPALFYAHAKHRAELVARAAFEGGANVVIVNPGEVYGPGDTALGTASHLMDFAKSIPVLVCDGGTSVVHVEDVARGIVAALERGRAGERYILGGENLTIRQMAELVLELVHRRMLIMRIPNGPSRKIAAFAVRYHIPVPFNPHVVPYATLYWFMDSGKAQRELGVTFRGGRETISSTIDWLREKGLVG